MFRGRQMHGKDFIKRVFLYLKLVAIMAFYGCAPSGCGCEGEEIPGGFPLEQRVENGGQLRISQSGFEFIKQNFTSLVDLFSSEELSFEMSPSSQDIPLVGTVDFCPDGGCIINVNILSFDLRTVPSSSIEVTVQVEVHTGNIPFTVHQGLACICWEDCQCTMDMDTRREAPEFNTFRAEVVFAIDPTTGYTTVDIHSATVLDELQGGDVQISNINICGFGVCNLVNVSFIKELIMGQVAAQLSSMIESSTAEMLCRSCGEYGCPEGSVCDGEAPGDFCKYPDGSCVPAVLGVEARIEPLSVVSAVEQPTVVKGNMLDVVFGAGGYAIVDSGLNLGFFVGARASTPSPCAVGIEIPPPEASPQASVFSSDWFTPCMSCADDESICGDGHLCIDHEICMRAHHQLDEEGDVIRCRTSSDCNTSAGFLCHQGECTFISNECQVAEPEPFMVGFGISEQAISRFVYSAVEGGYFCFNLTSPDFPFLTTSSLSAVFPLLKRLAWEDAPVSVSGFPSSLPSVEVSRWPLIKIEVPNYKLQFYGWIHHSWVKIISLSMTLKIGINIYASHKMIKPVIAYVEAEEIEPYGESIFGTGAESASGIFSSLITNMLPLIIGTDTIGEIEVGGVDFPDGSIMGVSEGGENFIAFFMNLALARQETPPEVAGGGQKVETYAEVFLSRGGFNGKHPQLVLHLDATGCGAVGCEFSYRLDDMLWSNWSTKKEVLIDSPIFLLDSLHRIEARARIKSIPSTIDDSPAEVVFKVDTHPPLIRLVGDDSSGFRVEFHDTMTDADKIRGYYKAGDMDGWKAVSSGERIDEVMDYRGQLLIKAVDEAGNESMEKFILDSTDGAGGEVGNENGSVVDSGAGCNVVSSLQVSGCRWGGDCLGLVVLILIVFFSFKRGSGNKLKSGRGSSALMLFFTFGLVGSGCSFETQTEREYCQDDSDCFGGSYCCLINHTCLEPPSSEIICDDGYHCEGRPEMEPETCLFTSSCCVENEPLDVGVIGSHTSFDISQDGKLWISGYSEGTGKDVRYGDLVSGQWNSEAGEVEWNIIDGVPGGATVVGAPSGWRGGVTASGDDVGLWTSSVVLQSGEFVVFYYDRTWGRLKVATGGEPQFLSESNIVDDDDDCGMYSYGLALDTGAVAVAYRAVREDREIAGRYITEVRYGFSSAPSTVDFFVETVASVATPCWAELCPAGKVCRKDNGLCVKPDEEGECNSGQGCASGQACIDRKCVDIVSYPSDIEAGIGIWNRVVQTTDGKIYLLYYDATEDRLVLYTKSAGSWNGGQVVVENGGWYPSMAADSSGNIHIVYSRKSSAGLYYMNLSEGVEEVVDNGQGRPDGFHLVGDNSSIQLSADGRVSATYMDSTSGRIILAMRRGPDDWTLNEVSPRNEFWGFYSSHKVAGDTFYIVSFYIKYFNGSLVHNVGVIECQEESAGGLFCY